MSDLIENNNTPNPNVYHPSHYQNEDGHECIDVMRKMFGDEVVRGFCKGNAFKYRFRAGKKTGNTYEQDIEKAEWYEDYLFKMDEEDKKTPDIEYTSEQTRWLHGLD